MSPSQFGVTTRSAVLDREAGEASSNAACREPRAALLDCGLGEPALRRDEKLPETECPPCRMVEMELSVSEDIVESGRMYSTLSENPTRTRGTTRELGDSSSSLTFGGEAETTDERLSDSCPVDDDDQKLSTGLTGALPCRTGGGGGAWSFGLTMSERSCEDIAADRR